MFSERIVTNLFFDSVDTGKLYFNYPIIEFYMVIFICLILRKDDFDEKV